MITKTIVTQLLILLILTSCVPEVIPVLQTEKAIPSSTSIALVPTNIFTPTSTPGIIVNRTDLSVWVDEYVHAYGGIVSVNGVRMDASQLTDEIYRNTYKYLETRMVNSERTQFIVVTGIPLATREGNGSWKEATIAHLGELNGVEFECSLRLDGRRYNEFLRISEKVLGNSPIVVWGPAIDVTSTFGDFTESDWQNIINDWENIEQDFTAGVVPPGYPYFWQWGIDSMDANVIRAFGGNPQFRAGLINQGLRPDGDRIQRLIHFQQHASQEDMLKIFEFVVRARVLQFPTIHRWDVSDEIAAGYVIYYDLHENPIDFNFWGAATGLEPYQLALKVAQWIKTDNPDAKTYINEPNIFDTGNPVATREREYFYQEFLPAIIAGNGNHLIDGVIAQNNWWIGEPQDWAEIGRRIDHLNTNGLEIGGSETMIVSGNTPINYCCGREMLVPIQDAKLAQADMFAAWIDLYLDKGVKTIGFSSIDDFYAWTQDVGLPDANPTIFDIEFRAKPAYYAIVKILYDHLP